MSDDTIAAAGLAAPAQPLEAGVRDQLSARFGHDFSRVRVHVGPEADAAARGLDATAYTVGNDVVFAQGAYDPLTAPGRSLIAHEMAHVAQHGGVAHAPNFLARDGAGLPAASQPLERQADLAAALSDRPLPRAWAWERATAPFLGRAERGWTPFEVPYVDETRKITELERLADDPSAVRIDMGEFLLPTSKGPWDTLYDAVAKAGGLQATTDVSGAYLKTGLWEKRAPTPELRRLWLQRVHWPRELAQQWWYEAGGSQQTSGEFTPKTMGGNAQIDHIVELQLGGTNVPENLAPHDQTDNEDSGRTIWSNMRAAATAVLAVLKDRPEVGTVKSLTLKFSSARQKTRYAGGEALSALPAAKEARPAAIAARRGTANHALQVHFTALGDLAAGSRPDPDELKAAEGELAARVNYPIQAGPSTATLRVPAKIKGTDLIEGDTANDAARELIPGLVLVSLKRTADQAGDMITGALNDPKHPVRAGTRLPIAIAKEEKQTLLFKVTDVGGKGILTLKERTNRIEFTYPYLSSGHLNLGMTADGLIGTGQITPSLPLLSKVPITVTLDSTGLHGSVAAPKDKLSLPPFAVTDASLTVNLGMPPSAGGHLGVQLANIVTGDLDAGVDALGLFVRGKARAKVPGLDEASGDLEYRPDSGLKGEVVATASRAGGLVRGGSVRVGLAGGDWTVTGNLELMLPGDNPARISAEKAKKGKGVVYSGHTMLTVPGLHPVDVTLSYDGEHVTGSASTTFSVFGLNGDMTLGYQDGVFTGKGTATFDRGRASGTVKVELDALGRISGKGSATVVIRPGLQGTVGVALGPERGLRVSGELAFPPYRFLEKRGGQYDLFHRDLPDIPLFAIPLGIRSIGLVARIGVGLSARYSLGPGEIRDLALGAEFSPLAKDSDVAVAAKARLVLPAEAGIELSLRAAAGLSVALASITGGITTTGGVTLRGGLDASLSLTYAKHILTFDAEAAIRVKPVLTLRIEADIVAEAGWLGSKRWPFELASYAYSPGLEFGMVVPLHYQSDQPLRLPEAKDIRWIVPDIDVSALVGRLSGQVRAGLGL